MNSTRSKPNLLATRRGRALLFGVLYASEGAPIGFIWWGLPALWRQQGGAVGEITGVLAAVTAMWALKFLWAPLVDALRTERWGFRAWIMTAQGLMGLALAPLIWIDPLEHLGWLVGLLLLHALCATTQDVAIDALAINSVPPAELGRVNGAMSAGKFIGRGLFGGVALIVAKQVGGAWMIGALVGVIWSALLLLWLGVPADAGRPARAITAGVKDCFGDFLTALRGAFGRRITWLALAFALLGGAGFESAGALTSPYLVDRGVPLETIGWFRTFAVVGAMIAGALLGGLLTDRLGKARATGIFLLALVVIVTGLAGVERWVPAEGWGSWLTKAQLLMGLLTGMYLCYGLFIAASYALFMEMTDPRLGATQFSTYMAATNGCESWSTWAGGQLVERSGYAASFLALSAVSLLTLPLLSLLRRQEKQPAPDPAR